MRYIYFICLLFLLLLFGLYNNEGYSNRNKIQYISIPHLDTAIYYYNLGVKEYGNNAGYYVEKFQKSVGISRGSPWCAAFVSYCILSNRKYIADSYVINSPLASKLNRKGISISYEKVLYKKYIPNAGDIVIWKRGETIYGHTGFVYKWDKYKVNEGYTIEGNVSNRVAFLKRKIEPLNYFRIRYFTPIKYKKDIKVSDIRVTIEPDKGVNGNETY